MKENSRKIWFAMLVGSVVGIFALLLLSFIVDMRQSDEAKQVEHKTEVREVASNEETKGESNGNPDAKVEYASSEWLTHGGDLYNRRYSLLDQVTTENIKDLKPVWVTSLGSGSEFKFSGEATPLVADGVMFVETGANDVLALDAKTGEKIWEYRPEIEEKLDTVCCGWTNRGVGLGEGKVFVSLLDARLVALDQKTGELLWETEVANWEEGYTITSAPLYYNGKVYTGVAGGEYGIRGRLTAYDANMGREVWRFNTIPGPGEEGYEEGSWPYEENDSWLTGGAPVWQTPAIDPELGYIYFAAGNTAPDLDGSNRAGDNLYADSVIALDVETGDYKWHFQEVHHDIWDLDPANPVVLYDVEMDGKMQRGIGQAGKTGWLYLLDRTDGTPLVGIEEKEVSQDERQHTSATQPHPVGDSFVPQAVTEEDVKRDLTDAFEGEIGSIFTPFWDVPITLKPGPQGGANWPPSAYNPETEYYYVLANDNYFSYTRNEDHEFKEGDMYIGSIFAPVLDAPSRGTVTAIDVKTNKIAWQQNWDAIAYSGVLTTKGNLVFVGHNDGRLIAYNAKTGDQVWEYMTDAGVNAPSISYEIDGVQYISVYAAGNSLAGSKHGDKVYTFKLDGDLAPGKFTDASEKTKPVDKETEDKTTSANTDKGLSLYESNCLACHGNLGADGHNGPNLQESKVTANKSDVIDRIKNGGSQMPAFKDILSEADIEAIGEYVSTVIAPLGEEN